MAVPAELQDAYHALERCTTPGDTLQRLDELKLAVSTAIDEQVSAMMLDPVGRWSWASIGALVGITRQAAHKRWSKAVDRAMSQRFKTREDPQ